MYLTIKGYYEAGKIIMIEDAPVDSKTEVYITFLTEADEPLATKADAASRKGKVALPEDFNGMPGIS